METTCSFAYAKHMIFFHGTAADRTKIVPKERKLKELLQCDFCAYNSIYGDRMALHLQEKRHDSCHLDVISPPESDHESKVTSMIRGTLNG
jgi:hypothetical protein